MPGSRVRNTFRTQASVEKEETIKPVPGLVAFTQTPLATAATDGENAGATPITGGKIGTIDGYRLKFDSTKADEGLFFCSLTTSAVNRVTDIQKNTSRQTIFLIPNLAPENTWRIEIRTRYTENGELRTGSIDGVYRT